jgi:hypothetical protein
MGIKMEANAVHPIKVLSPMVATFEGLSKVTPTRVVLFLKVLFMAVTGSPSIILGISTVVAVPVYPVRVYCPLSSVNVNKNAGSCA